MVQHGPPVRGVASLAVSMLLLFGLTVAVFYVNRTMLFEQKTSANQYRSTKAFEAAEAGLEWAVGMFNASGGPLQATVDANCAIGSGTQTFRDRYAAATLTGNVWNYAPVTTNNPGCSIASGAMTCSCPAIGSAALAGTNPGFYITVADTADPEAVEVISRGCANVGQCSATGGSAADGFVQIRQIVKARPNVRAVPAAALTTGGWANVCGSFNISNNDGNAQGYLVNSGSMIQIGNGTYTGGTLHQGETNPPNCGGGGGQTLDTVDGTPLSAAVITNDSSLWNLSSSTDAMFAAYFGMGLAQYREQNSQCEVSGNNAGNNAAAVISLYTNATLRCRNFYVNGPLQFSGNGTLGSANDPITLVSSSSMTFNGNYDIYGLVYSDSANWNDLGTGTSNVYGAVVSRTNYKNNGNGTITYDANVLKRVRGKGGLFVRVPGSWRDF